MIPDALPSKTGSTLSRRLRPRIPSRELRPVLVILEDGLWTVASAHLDCWNRSGRTTRIRSTLGRLDLSGRSGCGDLFPPLRSPLPSSRRRAPSSESKILQADAPRLPEKVHTSSTLSSRTRPMAVSRRQSCTSRRRYLCFHFVSSLLYGATIAFLHEDASGAPLEPDDRVSTTWRWGFSAAGHLRTGP